MRIEIKPLSINDAWKGRRYRTDKYKGFQREISLKLPNINIDFKGRLRLEIVFGFSSKGSDIDNPLKPFLDCLQKKYGLNDNQIYELSVKKEIVKKGNEFINFAITIIN